MRKRYEIQRAEKIEKLAKRDRLDTGMKWSERKRGYREKGKRDDKDRAIN
jgi:hypothetical protein